MSGPSICPAICACRCRTYGRRTRPSWRPSCLPRSRLQSPKVRCPSCSPGPRARQQPVPCPPPMQTEHKDHGTRGRLESRTSLNASQGCECNCKGMIFCHLTRTAVGMRCIRTCTKHTPCNQAWSAPKGACISRCEGRCCSARVQHKAANAVLDWPACTLRRPP